MTEHTPGPWYWTEHGVRPEDGPTSFRITGPVFPTLAFTNGYSALDEDNARLIAAAPDLLSALESAHERLYEHDLCLCEETPFEGVECQAAIAIAKARGQ